MYTIINSKVVKTDKGIELTRRVEIVCDTEADLPTPEEIASEGFTVGSLAWTVETGSIYGLNSTGDWINQNGETAATETAATETAATETASTFSLREVSEVDTVGDIESE